MSYLQHYDNHTLFVKCGNAYIWQIRELLYDSVERYNKDNDANLRCEFYVNLVMDQNGVSRGIAFVFVTNPSVYYMLLGKDWDGTDRVKYVDDPNWKMSENIVQAKEPIYPPGISWKEIEDIDAQYEKDITLYNNRKLCPKIAIYLEPLMSLSTYKLTMEQLKEENIDDSSEIYRHISLHRAFVQIPDNRFAPNILKCKNVPNYISEKDIKRMVTPYTSDPKTKHKRSINGKQRKDTYPFVNISDDRTAFVTFDPRTNDALFALCFVKRITVGDSTNKITLFFGNSYRKERNYRAKQTKQYKPRVLQ